MADKDKPSGFLIPNTTQFPNVLLDKFMRVVSDGVWKVLCGVVRKTYGWQKEWDAISQSQMCELTGLSDFGTREILNLLMTSGLLERGKMHTDEKGRTFGFLYRINVHCDIDKAILTLTPKDRTYKRGSNSVAGEGATQLRGSGGSNSVAGEGATQLLKGSNSVAPQNQLTKPTIKTKGEGPSQNVLLIAQKQFWDTFYSMQNGTEQDKYHNLLIAANRNGLTATQAKEILLNNPEWKDWKYTLFLDSQQVMNFDAQPSCEITAIDAGRAVCEMLGLNGAMNRQTAKESCETVKRRKPEMRFEDIPGFIAERWKQYDTQASHGKMSLKSFLGEIGRFVDSPIAKIPSGFKPATPTPAWADTRPRPK